MEDRAFIESLRGMRIGGRYVVDKVLGAGGMGVVATAVYPELQQKVAIKFLLPQHAANSVLNARFVREARLAAKVKSEHFVRVFDIGKLVNGIPYLVMELLAGRDLSDDLAETGALPIQQAVDYVLQAAIGIAEIHALGVVHRDLKPSNLYVAEAAGKRLIKVLDFGISKETTTDSGAPLTSTDNLLGTPQYMSPEQVRASKDVDPRSDIWSLGVILYETLTGLRPFLSEENAVGELFAKVLFTDPTPPRQHRSDLPEELEAVILKCLARDRNQRFADVGELAEALRPFAPPTAAHRIEAVHQALTARRSLVPPTTENGVEPASQALTAESSPAAKRDEFALAATSASEERPPANGGAAVVRASEATAPATAMTSSRASRSREVKQGKSGIIIAIGAAVAASAIALAVSRAPAQGLAPATAASEAASVRTAVAPPPSERPAAPEAVESSHEDASAAAESASTEVRTSAAAPRVARPTPPKGATRPPPTASTSTSKLGTSELILDRK